MRLYRHHAWRAALVFGADSINMENENLLLKHHTLWLILGWVWIVLVIYLSLTPHPPEIQMDSGDKLGHLLAYGFLMLWFAQLYRTHPTKNAIAIGLIGLGIAIEIAQEQTGYRHFELADIGADGIGVGIGLLLSLTPLREGLRLAERIVINR
jgi:VanZ family protein